MNLNNRETLLVPHYDLAALLALAQEAEALGFDSVWVGDSLFARPRYEPLSLLAALSQRTSHVRLGTACLITTLREPLGLALAWATIDVLSHGRLVMGACAGHLGEDGVQHEFAALGLDTRARMARFTEGLHVLRELLHSGSVTFHGDHFQVDDVSFYSGTELAPLRPIQAAPPIWVTANPQLGRPDAVTTGSSLQRAARRVLTYGDGWLTCCRAQHPEEVEAFLKVLEEAAAKEGKRLSDYEVAYQVTLVISDDRDEAERTEREYISTYYPEFGSKLNLADWGPAGSPEDVLAWIQRFAAAGVTTFICRFASADQRGQLQRFAKEVLPNLDTAVYTAGASE